ncbi:hypothetical protein Goklo_000629 [Gossypium klotzschianum]|uniref:Retrotransposon gag domain-containing protein n=1 Tax=Gossypium klotzschianum TaxID=34286 RepID=A0A7J8VXM4_9ROSI|nr:hypothetical protein [Gossypium klotzschianum]
MSKEEFEQRWARKSLMEMLSTVEECVGKLGESMEDAKEDSAQELLDSQRKKLTERNDALEAMVKALKEKIMVTTMALSTRIEELERELALCRAAVGKGVSSAALSYEGVPKPKEFVGTMSAYNVDNFLWRMENYFRKTTDKRQCEIGTWKKFQCELKGQFYVEFTEEEARAKLKGITQRGTLGEYVREFKELMLQVSDVTKKEALLAF